MVDEGTKHPNLKCRSKIIYGDEKVELFERSSKIHGPQTD
jgi:hypothetical protein